jgi:uncharacterized protein (UPF0335 family)
MDIDSWRTPTPGEMQRYHEQRVEQLYSKTRKLYSEIQKIESEIAECYSEVKIAKFNLKIAKFNLKIARVKSEIEDCNEAYQRIEDGTHWFYNG